MADGFTAPAVAAKARGHGRLGMDPFGPVVLGLAPTLHVHASGALTFCGESDGPSGWDDDAPVLAVAA